MYCPSVEALQGEIIIIIIFNFIKKKKLKKLNNKVQENINH